MVLCSDFLSRANFFNQQGETEITVVSSRRIIVYVLYVWRKIANFNELYNLNEFNLLQNEILITRKNITTRYYLIKLHKFA